MNWTELVAAEHFLESEVSEAEFGDRRLSRRLEAVVSASLAAPSGSFPEISGGDAALEGTYRFLNNGRVTPDRILAPHFRATAVRVRAAGRPVIVAHDTTEFSFGAHARGDLGVVGRGKSYGFDAHVSLAIMPGEERVPVGVLGVKKFNRPFGSRRLPNGGNKKKAGNITHRWLEQVRRVREVVGEGAPLVHVMDREADDYATLAGMVGAGERFVVRQSVDRRIRSRHEAKVRAVVVPTPLLASREVMLSARLASNRRAHCTRHPVRGSRHAHLEIRAATVHVERPPSAGGLGPEVLQLNLVQVNEPNPPPGCEPITWWLWTSEPIATAADVLNVIDTYRSRWCIEEYFKALKTGCALEKRQLESERGLLNALALFVPVAWRLLLLRSLARVAPEAPAATALTRLQLKALRGFMRLKHHQELSAELTTHEALYAVAKMGGHLTNNGEPGWIVLGRGFDRLLDVELGLSIARGDVINP